MDWYLKVLKNYIGFGSARRKEYWMFILVNLIPDRRIEHHR